MANSISASPGVSVNTVISLDKYDQSAPKPRLSISRLAAPALYLIGLAVVFFMLSFIMSKGLNYSTFNFVSSSSISYVEPASGYKSGWWLVGLIAIVILGFLMVVAKPYLAFLPVGAILLGTYLGGGISPDWGKIGVVPDGTDVSVVNWLESNEGLTFTDENFKPANAIIRGGEHEFVTKGGTVTTGKFINNGEGKYSFKRLPPTGVDAW